VRLLSVAQFGRYREFLLYVGLLTALAAFGVNQSLLYFVPAQPQHAWRFVRQAVALVAFNSVVGAILLIALDTLLGGALIGEFLLPVCLYVLLFVNVDFWEYLWVSLKRPGAVFAYSGGRVLARMTVVVVAASLGRDVETIITALIALEATRLTLSLIAWRRLARGAEAQSGSSWREHLRFCAPIGIAMMLITLNKSAAGLFIAKWLGPVALAHYAIGTYAEPLVTLLRNAISDALLPEMTGARAQPGSDTDPLALWRRTTVLSALLLVPAVLLLFRFAEPLVRLLFSSAYLPAAIVMQIFVLVLLRECFDFGVVLRALNRTAPLLLSNVGAIVVNLALLVLLVPLYGIAGAALAFVLSRFVDGSYLAWRTLRLYDVRLRDLACWGDLARVVVAAVIAAVPVYAFDWNHALGIAGVGLAVLIFAITFALCLRALRLPEAVRVFQRLRQPLGVRT
jgi:O-antigen/teichoic acid export membrane protein